MALAANPMGYSRSKYIDIQYHFVPEQLAWNIISLSYIPISNMAANSLTKALPKNFFQRLKRQLGLNQID